MTVRPIYTYADVVSNTTKKEIGIGIQFMENGVFTSTYTTTSQTKNQLINYILTNPGERFFNPGFGSGIRALLFEPNTDLDAISDNLKEGIELYVQNIIVKDVITTSNTDSNTIFIKISYSINNQQDELTLALNTTT
jgi:phage baseplate assembly protein W